MTIDTQTLQMLQALLALVLSPALLSMIGDIVASILAQDGFPQIVNDIIAWVVLIFAAVGSLFAANHLVPTLPGAADVLVTIIFLVTQGGMGKLKPYCAGLDWIQSNVFDVAKGANLTTIAGTLEAYTFDPTKTWSALLPEIEGIFQRNIMPLLQRQVQPVKPAPQPIVLGTPNVDLNQPMQWGIQSVQNPQELPAVKPQPTQPTDALPAQQQSANNLLQFADIQRHFGDSQVISAVQPGQGN